MRKFGAREKRFVVYAAVLFVAIVWDVHRRWWTPTFTLETRHFTILSSATPRQTEETAIALEILHDGYAVLLADLGRPIPVHERLKVKLYRDREEFRRCNRIRGWEEGFYRRPYSHQYYSTEEVHPYHSAMHEAVHQLNTEVTHLSLPKWLEEGMACYLSTSRIVSNRLCRGEVDSNTYPVWWLDEFGESGDLETDKRNGSVIPLSAILSGRGGQDVDEEFNLYYVHWWSLTRYLLHSEEIAYRKAVSGIVSNGEAAVNALGDVAVLERHWYDQTQAIKRSVAGRASPPPILRSSGIR